MNTQQQTAESRFYAALFFETSSGVKHEARKKRVMIDSLFNGSRQLPIFPGRLQPSIVGVCELNFCVRNRNRWILTA